MSTPKKRYVATRFLCPHFGQVTSSAVRLSSAVGREPEVSPICRRIIHPQVLRKPAIETFSYARNGIVTDGIFAHLKIDDVHKAVINQSVISAPRFPKAHGFQQAGHRQLNVIESRNVYPATSNLTLRAARALREEGSVNYIDREGKVLDLELVVKLFTADANSLTRRQLRRRCLPQSDNWPPVEAASRSLFRGDHRIMDPRSA